jgi:hypothetical protein
MNAMLQRLQEDEEIARELYIRLQLHRLALRHRWDIAILELDAVEAQIGEAFDRWRAAKETLDQHDKIVLLQPA